MKTATSEFIARGLASRDEARLTGQYFEANDVLCELGDMLEVEKIWHKSHHTR